MFLCIFPKEHANMIFSTLFACVDKAQKEEALEEEGRKGGEQRGEMTKQKRIGYISK